MSPVADAPSEFLTVQEKVLFTMLVSDRLIVSTLS